jgi:hypothetical protein
LDMELDDPRFLVFRKVANLPSRLFSCAAPLQDWCQ